MKKYKEKYRTVSNRMPGWDYSRGGKYYVTICTKNRICCFGDVVQGEMQLSEMGKIANNFWNGWQSRFYDEIIRNDERLSEIKTYICNNPYNWKTDEHNPFVL